MIGFAATAAVIATPTALSSNSASPTKIPIGTTGGILISAYGSAWTTDLTLDRLIRIDPKAAAISGKLRLGARPYGLAAGAGSVWVSLESNGTVVRIDPRRNRVVARIREFTDPNGLVYAYHALWVSDLGGGRVLRVNPRTNRITARIKIARADWITPGAGALWVSSERNRVYRLDPRTRKVTATVRVGANPLASAFVGGELWVPNIDSNTLSVVDPVSNAVSRTIPAGNAPLGVLSTPDGVFVSMSNDGAVWRFDNSG